MFGYSGSILRVDLTTQNSKWEPISSYIDHFIGGRGINVKLLFDAVDPNVDPFDPENLIIFGPGILTGTPVPTASRTQVTTLLPSGFLASSGIGGFIGFELRHAGLDNLVIWGQSEKPTYILISNGEVDFFDASHLKGKNTSETQRIIRETHHDPDLQIASIGPAGENLVSFACVMTGLGSAAGHGGLGSIMGSKNLKAIAVRGTQPIAIARMDEFEKLCLATRKDIQQNPAWQYTIESQGRKSAPTGVKAGGLPFGNLEEYYDLTVTDELIRNGEQFWKDRRVGRTGCAGCPVHHFGVFDVPGYGTGAPKCANWSSFATPIWNTDYEVMFQAGHLCNEYGLDFVSVANIIGFLMDLHQRGLISEKDTDNIPMARGDANGIIQTIHKIARQEGFGKLFRNGLLEAADQIGGEAVSRALVIKGTEMAVVEMRNSNAFALAYAVTRDPNDAMPFPEMVWRESPEAAEKLAESLCGYKEAAQPKSYKYKGPLLCAVEEYNIAAEMLGLCKWYLLYQTTSLEIPAKFLSLAIGKNVSESDLFTAAKRVKTLERACNVLRGHLRSDDTLPERLFDNPVKTGPFAGNKIDKHLFSEMVDDFYRTSGWDKNGIPQKQIFDELGLESESKIFEERMRFKEIPST